MSRVRSAVLRLLGDAKIASRRLRRAPLFAATAVLVLGLGIGIGTTCFNVINAGLFKGRASLPGAVRVVGSNWPPGLSGLLGPGDVAAVAEHPPASLAWVIGLGSARQTTARILDTSLRLRADGISGPYFKVFGATPIAGRLLDGGDEQSDLAPGAVISERLWRTRFSADSAVVGSTAYVAGQPIVIVGVVARPFTGLASIPATDLWVPSRVIPVDQLYGRLRDGVTVRQADQEVRSQYAVPVPGVTDRRLALESGFEADLPSSETAVLATILALGGLVLVIAAASLTLLLLARILGSQSDIGIRLMLGARLSDVAQLWATEVSIIAVAATVVGLTMGGWFARIVLDQFSAVAGMDTSNVDVSPDWRVVLYATGLTLVVAVGIIGALTKRISIVGTIAATTAAAGNGAITPRNGDTRGGLMAAQIAIATCLLLVSVYFWRSTMATAHIDPGFDPSHVVVARLDQAGRDGVRTEANNLRALAAAARAPGIDHAALATRLTARLGNGARTSEAAQTYSVQPVGVTAKFFDVL
ncbi:MAG: ABC transporter permease, partial [Acidobacteriota bacterium]